MVSALLPPAGLAQETTADSFRIDVAQAGDRSARELEPRYEPAPPPEKSWFNDSYLFALTRGVRDSTLQPWAKVTLYPLTVPLDLVFLPFATIGGMFG
jgi:hypothetical protein